MKIAEAVKVRPRPEWVFDVDGKTFPWFITQRGPKVTRHETLYTVHVELYCVDMETKEVLGFRSSGYHGHVPVIGDTEFPWEITEDGYVYRTGLRVLPSVTLSFFAENVDIDSALIDDRREIRNIEGTYVG